MLSSFIKMRDIGLLVAFGGSSAHEDCRWE